MTDKTLKDFCTSADNPYAPAHCVHLSKEPEKKNGKLRKFYNCCFCGASEVKEQKADVAHGPHLVEGVGRPKKEK